jgi:4-hydroxybutyrate CoA-transferase
MVTALRTDVDIVVTEFGVARLKNLPDRARAAALIDIAAPEFRQQLKDQLA